MVLFAHKDISLNINGASAEEQMLNVVHPDLYLSKSEMLQQIIHGDYDLKFYGKLLVKGVLRKLNLR